MTTEPTTSALETVLPAFVRAFGLHRPLQTPCGVSVSVAEAHALTELSQTSLSQTMLASRLQLEKSTVSRLVTQMEHQGWLTRSQTSHDTRVRMLMLTSAGHTIAKQVGTARAATFARLRERLSTEEQAQIIAAFERLVEALSELD